MLKSSWILTVVHLNLQCAESHLETLVKMQILILEVRVRLEIQPPR